MNDVADVLNSSAAVGLAGSWRSQALCRGRYDLFLSSDDLDRQIAAAVCRSCPVRVDCAAVADRIGAYGICGTWGGVWRG